MATQTVQPGSSTAQEPSLTIYLYSDDDTHSPLGSVTYQQSDTVLDIKRRVQAQLHYLTESQRLVIRSRVPNTPIQQLGDTGRPSDTDGTPSIRVDLASATNPVSERTPSQEEYKSQESNSNNRLTALDADKMHEPVSGNTTVKRLLDMEAQMFQWRAMVSKAQN
ncbi:unnamed protein product [Fusarium graminearum]|nr:unnamed protein product [Fusarium graminearum]VTO84395.1 unnamed protein product [Fusarium graminearum]